MADASRALHDAIAGVQMVTGAIAAQAEQLRKAKSEELAQAQRALEEQANARDSGQ